MPALNWPKDVALDAAGNLYIADTANNAMRKVSPGGMITTLAARLNQPAGLALDNSGNLYVSDTNNFRVLKITASGAVAVMAGNGTKGYSGDGGPATGARSRIQRDWRSMVRAISSSAMARACECSRAAGTITTVAGNGVVGFTGDGGPASKAETGAWGLAFDAVGHLYVADPWNNVVRLLR